MIKKTKQKTSLSIISNKDKKAYQFWKLLYFPLNFYISKKIQNAYISG